MIFVTVGHQMPFDRMIRMVDQWAGTTTGLEIFAQVGESEYRPKNFEFARLLGRADFDAYLERSSSIVAHAGTGTIIQVLIQRKPLLVFPRLSRFGETRNDHQVGTARHFALKGQVLAAFDEESFLDCLGRLNQFQPHIQLGNDASPQLIARIRTFLTSPTPEARDPDARL